jgi:exopolyphosphatase/guanosine-5'-triphosphate,3'-diphosphate pyrophosphatase
MFVDLLLRMSPESRLRMKGLPASRAHTIVPAAIVLRTLMRYYQSERMIVCTGGIREGWLFEQLSDPEQSVDPLRAYIADIMPEHRVSSEYAKALNRWLAPLAEYTTVCSRILHAFTQLSDAAVGMHSENRAEWAFDLVTYSSCTGLTHQERITLALCCYHRFRNKLKYSHDALNLLNQQSRLSAQIIGQAAAIAYGLSGGAAPLLEELSLEVREDRITIKQRGSELTTFPEDVKKTFDGLGLSLSALSSLER